MHGSDMELSSGTQKPLKTTTAPQQLFVPSTSDQPRPHGLLHASCQGGQCSEPREKGSDLCYKHQRPLHPQMFGLGFLRVVAKRV